MNILSTLLEISIYSGIILLLIILFKKIFQKKLSATIQFAVWSLFILRLLMPFSIDSGMHFIVYPSNESAQEITQNSLLNTSDKKTADYYLDNSETSLNEALSLSEETESHISYPQLILSEQQEGNVFKFETYQIVIIIWLLGVLICLVHMITTYIQLKKSYATVLLQQYLRT